MRAGNYFFVKIQLLMADIIVQTFTDLVTHRISGTEQNFV